MHRQPPDPSRDVLSMHRPLPGPSRHVTTMHSPPHDPPRDVPAARRPAPARRPRRARLAALALLVVLAPLALAVLPGATPLVGPRPAAGFRPTAARPDDDAATLLRRLAEHQADITTLSGRFRQEVETPLLARPLVSTGRFAFRRDPPCLVLMIEEPRQSTAWLTDDAYQVHRPADGTAERWTFPEDGALAGALSRLLAGDDTAGRSLEEALARHVRLEPLQRGDGPAALVLVPLDDGVREHVTRLTLLVEEGESPALRGLAFATPEGDVTTIRLQDVVRNGDVPASVFRMELPAGTRLSVRTLAR